LKKVIALLSVICLLQIAHAQNTNMLTDGPPVFHGAQRVGAYPNTEFVFTVPATGERPIHFTVQNLPKGLMLDAPTGIIHGYVKEAGTYLPKVTATNKQGTASLELRIVVGDTLALTPPMGWNSWNVFTSTVDEKMLIEMADAMVSTGMRDVGYQYINIDDYWHAASRDSFGRPVADPVKFPHGIKYVADYIHAKGLRLGIYSCAGDKTCGKCFGGYTFEDIDAKTYAEWGVDLLKYDFCFTPWKKKEAIKRYTAMGTALKKSGRSIVFSLCNWGLFAPWKWAQQTGGQYWRITPDIFDTWKGGSMFRNSMMYIVKRNNKLYPYAGPGHFNDPDMLIVGNYGKGKATSRNGHFKGMTDTEYQTHMSLWCMQAAPLLSSNDLRSMNDCTDNILTNPEILDIDQDALGEQAKIIDKKGKVRVYLKHLHDGSMAIAVFNTGKKQAYYKLNFNKIGTKEAYNVRDVWRHKNFGKQKDYASVFTAPHETVVLKLSEATE